MKITLEAAMDAFFDFMSEQVKTINDALKRAGGLIAVGSLKNNPENIVSMVKPWMEMSGFLKDGMVDIDMLKAGLENLFATEPKISYLGFGFNSDDAANLVAKMMSRATPPMTTTTTVTTTEVEA